VAGPSIIVVQVTGARQWDNEAIIEEDLKRLVARYGIARLLVVEGGAAGADTCARNVCKRLGVYSARVDALWDTYHRSAGPQRNEFMLVFFRPRLVLAYHWDLKQSKGTADMVERARRKGIKVVYRKTPLRVALLSVDEWHKLREKKARRKK
jgi:YspA, cpYpsA-related SLOG family